MTTSVVANIGQAEDVRLIDQTTSSRIESLLLYGYDCNVKKFLDRDCRCCCRRRNSHNVAIALSHTETIQFCCCNLQELVWLCLVGIVRFNNLLVT